MKKLITVFALSLALLAFKPQAASAGIVCTPIYGGGESCVSKGEIAIDKKVCYPTANCSKKETEKFVDNLYISDPKYNAGDSIIFRLTVTNNGDSTLNSVEVKDSLPKYVIFVSGPGKFDPNTKTLTYTIKNLKPKESKTDTLVVKVVSAADLPIQNGSLCTVNQSFATMDEMNDQDNAQFCIEKKVLGKGQPQVLPATTVKTTPATGPEMLPLIGLIPAALAGFALRKRTITFKGGEK